MGMPELARQVGSPSMGREVVGGFGMGCANGGDPHHLVGAMGLKHTPATGEDAGQYIGIHLKWGHNK